MQACETVTPLVSKMGQSACRVTLLRSATMQARHTLACKELGAEDPGRWALSTAEGMQVYPTPSGSGSGSSSGSGSGSSSGSDSDDRDSDDSDTDGDEGDELTLTQTLLPSCVTEAMQPQLNLMLGGVGGQRSAGVRNDF